MSSTLWSQGVQPGPLPAGLSCPATLAFAGADLVIVDRCENAVLVAHHP